MSAVQDDFYGGGSPSSPGTPEPEGDSPVTSRRYASPGPAAAAPAEPGIRNVGQQSKPQQQQSVSIPSNVRVSQMAGSHQHKEELPLPPAPPQRDDPRYNNNNNNNHSHANLPPAPQTNGRPQQQEGRTSYRAGGPTAPDRSRASSFFLGADPPRSDNSHNTSSSSTNGVPPAVRSQSVPGPRIPHQQAPGVRSSSSSESQEASMDQPDGSAGHRPSQQHSRRSSFYGLDAHVPAPPPLQQSQTQPTGGPTADRPIPRSSTASTTMSQLAQQGQRKSSMPDYGAWGRRTRDRTFSAISSVGNGGGSVYGGPDPGSVPPPAVPRPAKSRPQLGQTGSVAVLSHAKTLDAYRANSKKMNDPESTYALAEFILNIVHDLADDELDLEEFSVNVGAAQGRNSILPASSSRPRMLSGLNASASSANIANNNNNNNSNGNSQSSPGSSSSSVHRSPLPGAGGSMSNVQGAAQARNSFGADLADTKRNALVLEAASLLKKCADKGHQPSQITLANLHLSGILSAKGKPDWDRALVLFVAAGKHNQPAAAFRAGQGYENGWGARKDAGKAVQWYKKAASANYPAAMFRLGMAEIKGEMGMPLKPKEGFKWLNRASERAEDPSAPQESINALYHIGRLHEVGIEHVVFVDNEYAAECYARAAELGHVPSALHLGECYEYGRMGCPQDAALSIHFYNIAAQQNHPDACFALTSWYLTGADGILPQSDTEAFLWAKKAAETGHAKAQYACGFFTENGRGTTKDLKDALAYYAQAAEGGEWRAIERIEQAQRAGEPVPLAPKHNANGNSKRRTMADRNRQDLASDEKADKNCIIS